MKAKIENIINEIDKKISDADESNKSIPKSAQEHLIFFRSLLKDGLIREKPLPSIFKDAILYIENIKVQSVKGTFFSKARTITMRDQLGRSAYLSNHEAPSPLIIQSVGHRIMLNDPETLEFFKAIYGDLTRFYPTNGWNYTYPLEQGQVMNQVIGDWQNEMIPINPSPTNTAYQDFKRNYTLAGKKEEDDELITRSLQGFIEQTDYLNAQKETVLRWIQENGGQKLNRFITELLASGELTGHYSALAEADSLLNDWSIENGRMVFNYECCIYSYLNENSLLLKNTATGSIVESEGEDRSLPLLFICAKIELECVEQRVIPIVSYLNVSSFSPDLPRPDIMENNINNIIK